MKLIRVSFFLRLLMEARGQTTMMVGLAALAFIGITGVAIDLGHGYFALQQLQASSNAAALAGAAAMPNTTAAISAVTLYSATSGGNNANSNLTSVSLGSTPSFKCLSTLSTKLGLGCPTASGSVVVRKDLRRSRAPHRGNRDRCDERRAKHSVEHRHYRGYHGLDG